LPAVLTVYGISLAPLGAVASSIAAFVALLVALGTTSAVVLACLNIRIVDGVPSAREVEAYGWLRACTVAGLAIGPAVGGVLIDVAGPALAFAAAGAIAGFGALIALPRPASDSTRRR
jgi:predicted MFS family arabinose efflux permease